MTPRAAPVPSVASRAADSTWGAGLRGLAASLESELGVGRGHLDDEAARLAQPGPVTPTRALRHAAALGVGRAIRLGTRLPGDLLEGTPWRDPQRWARETAVEAFVDQLALGGAPTAEVARLMVAADGLFPTDLTDEIERRGIRAPALREGAAEDIVARAFGPDLGIAEDALTETPVSLLYGARLDDEHVAVRVRRPGVSQGVRDDTRLTASFVAPLQRAVPQISSLHPLGFVQLSIRQALESTDMRYEALNAIELGVLAESMAIDGLTVPRPRPDGVTRHAVVSEWVEATPLVEAGPLDDPGAALASVVRITLESALVHGVFWADPAPEHLLVRPDGTLVLVGTGTVGHLPLDLKVAGIRFLRAFLSADHGEQVAAMEAAGAVPPDADVEALLADLGAAEKLQLTTILAGGEQGLLDGLNEAVRLLLRHRLRPPLEVTLLLRTVFALGSLAGRLDPGGGGLAMAVMPLVQRLPDLLAAAEDEPDPT